MWNDETASELSPVMKDLKNLTKNFFLVHSGNASCMQCTFLVSKLSYLCEQIEANWIIMLKT